jgi:hypothetical protein
MQRMKELMRQHRVAACEAIPVRSIDSGQVIEYAYLNFWQLRQLLDFVDRRQR